MDSRTTGRPVTSSRHHERAGGMGMKTWRTVGLVLLALSWSACCSAPAVEARAEQVEVPAAPDDTPGPEAKAQGPADARCTAAQDFSVFTPEEAQAWRTECKSAFDCTKPAPPKACCLALTPECMRCADEGRQLKAAFDFACFGATEPMPEVVDCSVPPPLTPCCKALLPKCLDCVAKNRYLAELHRAQCGDAP